MTDRHDPSTIAAGLTATSIFTRTTFSPDIFNSRIDFSSDDSSRTRHFQKVPQTCFQTATSFYFTSATTTTCLPLDGSSSPKSRPDSVLGILDNPEFSAPLWGSLSYKSFLGQSCYCKSKRNQLPLSSPPLCFREILSVNKSWWVGACNSTTFLSRRFDTPIYF